MGRPRQHNAWMMYGDGRKLMDEVYDGFGVLSPFRAGKYRRPDVRLVPQGAETPADFQGLKMRTAGFGGKVMAKLGRRAAADRRRRHLSGRSNAAPIDGLRNGVRPLR